LILHYYQNQIVDLLNEAAELKVEGLVGGMGGIRSSNLYFDEDFAGQAEYNNAFNLYRDEINKLWTGDISDFMSAISDMSVIQANIAKGTATQEELNQSYDEFITNWIEGDKDVMQTALDAEKQMIESIKMNATISSAMADSLIKDVRNTFAWAHQDIESLTMSGIQGFNEAVQVHINDILDQFIPLAEKTDTRKSIIDNATSAVSDIVFSLSSFVDAGMISVDQMMSLTTDANSRLDQLIKETNRQFDKEMRESMQSLSGVIGADYYNPLNDIISNIIEDFELSDIGVSQDWFDKTNMGQVMAYFTDPDNILDIENFAEQFNMSGTELIGRIHELAEAFYDEKEDLISQKQREILYKGLDPKEVTFRELERKYAGFDRELFNTKGVREFMRQWVIESDTETILDTAKNLGLSWQEMVGDIEALIDLTDEFGLKMNEVADSVNATIDRLLGNKNLNPMPESYEQVLDKAFDLYDKAAETGTKEDYESFLGYVENTGLTFMKDYLGAADYASLFSATLSALSDVEESFRISDNSNMTDSLASIPGQINNELAKLGELSLKYNYDLTSMPIDDINSAVNEFFTWNTDQQRSFADSLGIGLDEFKQDIVPFATEMAYVGQDDIPFPEQAVSQVSVTIEQNNTFDIDGDDDVVGIIQDALDSANLGLVTSVRNAVMV